MQSVQAHLALPDGAKIQVRSTCCSIQQNAVPCCGLAAAEPMSLSQQNPSGKGPSSLQLSPCAWLVELRETQLGRLTALWGQTIAC